MEKKSNNTSDKSHETSLGILNMDNMKVFGDISSMSSTSSRVSDRLNMERLKAFQTLQKSQKGQKKLDSQRSMGNKENCNKSPNMTNSLNHDCTDYIHFHRPNTINISDLVMDESINLGSISGQSPVSKGVKISFEPAEITGRSTVYNKHSSDVVKKKVLTSTVSERMSVNDILASSFAQKARNLCSSLGPPDDLSVVGRHALTMNSSLNTRNTLHSLPRTADMSLTKALGVDASFNAGGTFSFTTSPDVNDNASVLSSEEFAPGELMQSKLIMDEISWAQEYAAIPAAALSKKAKAKAIQSSMITSNEFDSSSPSNSINPNYSVGTFFNMRSDNICNIVKFKSPDRNRTPIALVDDDDRTITTLSNLESDYALTPQIDNKTYSKASSVNAAALEKGIAKDGAHDSGNSSNNSYLLSLSAIDRALCNLDIHTDDSDSGVINEILKKAKKSKSGMNSGHDNASNSINSRNSCNTQIMLTAGEKQSIIDSIEPLIDLMSENKENLDPMGRKQLSDTLSFRESLLNHTDMKQLNRSSTSQPRSPLSPLQLPLQPEIQITADDDNEADVDEWPSTPIKSPNRRVRRTKSPTDGIDDSQISKDNNESNLSIVELKTPTNKLSSQCRTSTLHAKGKSLCSTHLDIDKNTSAPECDFGLSSNLSSKSSIHRQSNGVIARKANNSPHSNLASNDVSPLTSPRSYISSQRSSPIAQYRSSDERYLNVGGGSALYKGSTSPLASEPGGLRKYRSGVCGETGRIYKSSSLQSVYAARSISRCSSSSEFSHRDGKVIPLKVTALEMSWGSTKLRTNVRKSMQIKNTSGKRLVVRIEIHGPGYQIVNAVHGNTLMLQSQECRSIIVNFCPTVIGVAIGVLSFHSPHGATTNPTSFLDIPLYGYGGHCSIIPQNILKGPVGSAFLPMGELRDLACPLERSFGIYNKGPLTGFAIIAIDSIGLNLPRLSDVFEVHPKCLLIPAGSVATVRVVFRPKREDVKKIIKKITNVLQLANMHIICGDDVNRQRMRRLVQQMSPEDGAKISPSNSMMDKLWTTFAGEVAFDDFGQFKENPQVAFDLLTCMRVHEIALTLNHDSLDETKESSSLFLTDVDESVLFRTIYNNSPIQPNILEPVEEMHENSIAMSDNCCDEDERIVSSSTCEGSWSVSPSSIELNLNVQEHASLLICNSFKSRQYFKVACSTHNLLSFTPYHGYIAPDGGEIVVQINSSLQQTSDKLPKGPISVVVYMGNEHITLPVKFVGNNN